MSDITLILSEIAVVAKSADLFINAGYKGRFSTIAQAAASSDEAGEKACAEFATFMAANGGMDKAAYLVVRDELRALLRLAERLQRLRRKAEKILIADGKGETIEREQIYVSRIMDRRYITRLIAARRAGKVWAAAQARQPVAA